MRVPLIVAITLVSGCSKEASLSEQAKSAKPEGAKGSASPPGSPELRGGEGDPSGAASAAPEGARTVVDVADCTAKCVDRDSMRSEPPEKIESDCRARCKASCEAQCDSGSEASKAACRAECELE